MSIRELISIKLIIFIIVMIIALLLPSFLPPYYVYLICLSMVMSIYALAFNLLFGDTGLLSFGHALLFGVGIYGVALLQKYTAINSFELILLIVIVASIIFSATLGIVCVRSTEVYFTMLTLGFGQLFYALIVKFGNITGGTDGLPVSVPTVLGYTFEGGKMSFITFPYYYIILIILLLSILSLWRIINSPFGKTLQAIRDNPERARFIGISLIKYREVAFVVSGAFSGLAGMLFSILHGHVTPEMVDWLASARIVFITLLGGYDLFIGPIVGAFVYTFIDVYMKALFEYWEFLMGAFIILFVVVFPRGIGGGIDLLVKKLSVRRRKYGRDLNR